ncbi:Xaa-Pro dipeptidase [Pleurostoma richardsiae]|uniref:Xaa-Pro aminopeptidase n=1 Tax=Pleurostoma richardsiae TaxID=41990 RepID=A0AA38REW2_9PEZI|nr:Xaa-Pro dipeptidase [Pleurostoma richardsiae]
MEVEHDLVVVDEFDALSIEVKVPSASYKPPQKYPAKTHARKVAKELGFYHGLIYLPGEKAREYEDSDQQVPFRQRKYFFYLSGANFPGCAVTYDIAKDWLTLWIPHNEPVLALWYGTTPTVEECKAKYDVDDVKYVSKLEKYICAVPPTTIMYILKPEHGPPKRERPCRGPLHLDTYKLRKAMDAARVVKTDYEVAMIRRATDLSSAAHRAVLERLRGMKNEGEIEAAFRGSCLAQGAKMEAYPVIAGSGPNAAALHYSANDESLEGRQLVVLDAAYEWAGYASDITRTFPVSGRFTPEARAVYDVVDRMQRECVSRITPGVLFYDLTRRAHLVAAEGLLALGIFRGGGTPEEIVANGTTAAFFPHGLGHHVGLEVHDVSGPGKLDVGAARLLEEGARGGAAGKRAPVTPEMLARAFREGAGGRVAPAVEERQRLAKNMIVTVEPGIYFFRPYVEGLFLNSPVHAKYIDKDVLEKFYPVGGVRIEDDILVTEDGYENLTTAPKGEEALKIINGSGR